MDEPRPRTAPPELIIEDPKLQTPGQRVFFGTLTVVFWVLWVYLWLPLLTLAGWVFGIRRFVDVMVVGDGLAALRAVLTFYLVVICAMGGTLVLWATYNRLRFSGKERRTAQIPARSSAVLARALGRRESTVLVWQHEKALRVLHHPDGRIAIVEIIAAPWHAPSQQTTAGARARSGEAVSAS